MEKLLLLPGFRFHPTDVELVKYYLRRKVMGKKLRFDVIAEVDIYKYAPWDLPDKSYLRTGDLKWYFFCPLEKKYTSGFRRNRATECGFWKTTGKDRTVLYNKDVVGKIKTLVFHRGRAPQGDRTDWVMHEYRLEEKGLVDNEVVKDEYVLCAVFQKDGRGPRNGAQYGAPFREEDWSDDEEINCAEGVSPAGISTPAFVEPVNPIASVAPSPSLPACLESSSKSCLSNTLPSAEKVSSEVPDASDSLHGARFKEQDQDCNGGFFSAEVASPVRLATTAFTGPGNETGSVDKSSFLPAGFGSSAQSCLSNNLVSAYKVSPEVPNAYHAEHGAPFREGDWNEGLFLAEIACPEGISTPAFREPVHQIGSAGTSSYLGPAVQSFPTNALPFPVNSDPMLLAAGAAHIFMEVPQQREHNPFSYAEAATFPSASTPAFEVPLNQMSSFASNSNLPVCNGSPAGAQPTNNLSSAYKETAAVPNDNNVSTFIDDPQFPEDDDISSMLANFTEDYTVCDMPYE